MIGQTISHYRIVDEISRGGMGIVYRAVDVALNREVALKILPPELVANPDRRGRFIQEAQAASALEHPHIAVIHEVGEAGGVYFIAMELIRGEKLSDVLLRGPLKVERALDLAIEIAEALGRAHDKGIVHRDLKPANVMITEYGHAKVIDFGLAKLVEAVPGDLSRETGQHAETDPGVMLGTVAYMAPEQARGAKVDQRADIFAFGIVLHEMLSGHAPFRAQTGLDTLHAILNSPAPSLPPLASDSATELQRIVSKCLEKDPDARYQGMKDLVVDLRAARRRSEASSGALRAPALPASGGTARPRWIPWAAIGAGLVVVGAIAAVMMTRRTASLPAVTPDPSSKPSVAVMYFENNTGNTQLDWLRKGLTDMIVTDLSQSPNVDVLGTDRLYQILSELKRQDDPQVSFDVVQEVANRAGIQNVLLGSYMKAGDVIRISLKLQEAKTGRIITSERVDAAGESNLLSMVDELTRRIKARFDIRPAAGAAPLLAKPAAESAPAMMVDRELREVTTSSIEAYRSYVEGVDLHNQVKEALAAPLFERAVALDPGFAMAYAKLAIVHNNLNHTAESFKYSKLALDHAERLTRRERFYIEGVHYSRSYRDLPRAMEAYRQGLALFPEHVSARNNIALLYAQLGFYDEAIPHYEDAVRRRTPFVSAYGNLSTAYLSMGDREKGRQVVETYVAAHPDSGSAAYQLATLNLRLGKLDEAVTALARARALGVTDWRADFVSTQVAILRDDWAALDAAGRALRGAPDVFARWLGSSFLAIGALYQGRSAEGVRHWEDAAAGPGADMEFRATARSQAAIVLLARNEPRLARALADKALSEAVNMGTESETLRVQTNALDAAGRHEDADRTLERMRKLGEPPLFKADWRMALLAEGEVALRRGHSDQAIEALNKAAALLPPRGFFPPPVWHAPIWFALGSAYFAGGRHVEAEPWFRRIADSTSERNAFPIEYVRSHYFLGRIAEQRGDLTKAREHYRRFVELWKDGDLDRARVAEATAKIRQSPNQ